MEQLAVWDISRRTHGAGSYWRQVAQANPGEVFRDGELILVGAVLQLPVIGVPSEPVGTVSDGHMPPEPAFEPRGVCTEEGDFEIYPDDFDEPLPASEGGARNVRQSEYDRIVAEAEASALARADPPVCSEKCPPRLSVAAW